MTKLCEAKNRVTSGVLALGSCSLGTMVGTLYNNVTAFCATTPTPTPTSSSGSGSGADSRVSGIVDNLTGEVEGDDPLSSLTDTVQSAGTSIYNALLVFGIACFIVALMIFGIQMALGNGQERQQGKGNILWIVIGALVFFGATSIIMWFASLAGSFTGD